MGYSVYGTDLESRMIEYSKTNLDWLKSKYPSINDDFQLKAGDATCYKWQPMPSIIAGESFLGRPLSSLPSRDELNNIVQAVNTLHKKVFENIYKQMPAGGRLCLAVPAWQTKPGKFISLPILDQLAKIGYNQLEFKLVNTQDLIYARADQIVGRQLVVLTK
jgi:tRNA G10  N-methylase Trm11